MRHRIFYLAPDIPCARHLMDDLLLARVEERHIHVLARRGAPMDGLHEASVLQKSDLVHGAQMGLLLGAVLGCALGAAVAYALMEADGGRVTGRMTRRRGLWLRRCSPGPTSRRLHGLKDWIPRSFMDGVVRRLCLVLFHQ